MLTFQSGGWALLLAGLLVAAVFAWQLSYVISVRQRDVIGDGKTVASYGYDLSNITVPAGLLVASGMPKDGMPALTDPPVITPAEADAYNEEHRGKYLVPSDRVIGVVRGDEARAYPIRVLNWHEIVNDTLGGRAIAVTYSPLCDSVAVFDRQTGGAIRTFGYSGLLYNSNLVMYNRFGTLEKTGKEESSRENSMESEERHTGAGTASLWSQLGFQAIAGPAAAEGLRLEALPCAVVSWGAWRRMHPETTVLKPDPERMDRYKRNPYGSYFNTEAIKFPVRARPEDSLWPGKTRVIAVKQDGEWGVFAFMEVAEHAAEGNSWTVRVGERPVELEYQEDPPTVVAQRADGTQPDAVVYAFWFAWEAMQGIDEMD
jgi:hypothetical protein